MMSLPAPAKPRIDVSDGSIRPKPLTDPADLISLLGRFATCVVLCGLTVILLFKGYFAIGGGVALVSLIMQRATTKLYRRLRDDRMAAEAERSSQSQSTADVTATSHDQAAQP